MNIAKPPDCKGRRNESAVSRDANGFTNPTYEKDDTNPVEVEKQLLRQLLPVQRAEGRWVVEEIPRDHASSIDGDQKVEAETCQFGFHRESGRLTCCAICLGMSGTSTQLLLPTDLWVSS